MSDLTLRPLRDDELADAYRLGRVTFGGPADPPSIAVQPVPGWERLGVFDRTGRMVGKATDLGHEQWWGGRRVPTADVGGVAVEPEAVLRGDHRTCRRARRAGRRARRSRRAAPARGGGGVLLDYL